MLKRSSLNSRLKITNLRLQPNLKGANELILICSGGQMQWFNEHIIPLCIGYSCFPPFIHVFFRWFVVTINALQPLDIARSIVAQYDHDIGRTLIKPISADTRRNNATPTPLLRQNDVATSFWRNDNAIIASYIRCDTLPSPVLCGRSIVLAEKDDHKIR